MVAGYLDAKQSCELVERIRLTVLLSEYRLLVMNLRVVVVVVIVRLNTRWNC